MQPRCDPESCNATLAHAYQIKEELRVVLSAPDRDAMAKGLDRILRRTQRRSIVPIRRLHYTLNERYNEILALAEHRPAVGRIEALNNSWETLVRRARGYRGPWQEGTGTRAPRPGLRPLAEP